MPKKKEEEILWSLSPIERKILPFLSFSFDEIAEKSKLGKTAVLRALEFLSNKEIIKLEFLVKKKIVLGVNGLLYLKKGLPERRLLNLVMENSPISLEEVKKLSRLSENEFRAAFGVLKRKVFVKLEGGKIFFIAKKEEAQKKMLEEIFLEQLPLDFDKLTPEQKYCVEQLKGRKDIIKIQQESEAKFSLTDIGKKIMKEDLSKISLVEQLTSEMLQKGTWKGKRFRAYDIKSKIPVIFGGKRQVYYAFLQEVREKLVALGFEEMTGEIVENEFWNFDALFQPQFHVAREWASTYYAKNVTVELPPKKIVDAVKRSHEKSWQYEWDEKKASLPILRPQGTVLSAHMLASKPKAGKYFAIARCYRPDVVDAQHLTEFNQVEGIIIDKDINFRNLLGILKLFAEEIAHAQEVKFIPDYYPFTEPSVQLSIKDEKIGWIEIGGAGIFREEVTKPLGVNMPVLAWGLGIDRLAMCKLGIFDIRMLFSQDLEWLRKM